MSSLDFKVPEDVQTFMRCMRVADSWSAEDVLDFIEKPWHWQREFDLWQSAKKPQPEDDNFAVFARWLVVDES